jgi:homoserine O-acetyltransferase
LVFHDAFVVFTQSIEKSMSSEFESSDSIRHAKPLMHSRSVTFERPLALEAGGLLPNVTVAFETYGQLNAARDNAVLICHALTGDSHVAKHDENDDPGWWDIFVGPGKPLDTDRYFVICPNILGGCRGTTGPCSVNPETGEPYGADFPIITIGDMVQTQKWLVEHLGIDRLRAVIGGSLGGHLALTWATRFPDALAGVVLMATAAKLTSQALAFDIVGRNAILRDPAYHNGQYYDKGEGPLVGLAIARMLGHITYLSREAMTEKFDAHRSQPREVRTKFETRFAVGSYLAYQADRFGERFDPNSYLAITMALDLFDLGGNKADLAKSLSPATCRWLVISFSSDWLFPPFQSREIVDALVANDKSVSYCNIESNCGHDAFLLPNELPVFGEMNRAFLAQLDKRTVVHSGAGVRASDAAGLSPTSIFHRYRLDYNSILELIPEEASVLDLGCGTGGLMARLRDRGHRRIVGLELDERAILTCVDRGLDVVQADLNKGLAAFADRQFDFVVLSQTLQAVVDVERVVTEMLRVGSKAIVSFPNFAYHKTRTQLFQYGRAPQMGTPQGFAWYNTPNVRFLSITDFEEFCLSRGVKILQQIDLNTEDDVRIYENSNLNADVAIMVLSR